MFSTHWQISRRALIRDYQFLVYNEKRQGEANQKADLSTVNSKCIKNTEEWEKIKPWLLSTKRCYWKRKHSWPCYSCYQQSVVIEKENILDLATVAIKQSVAIEKENILDLATVATDI